MKESAGGEDEVTVGMIKEAPAATRLVIFNVLVGTWNADETAEFETSTLRVVVVMLWKRKVSKEDFDQYLVVRFPAIISRILARNVGSRILAYFEKIGSLNNSQWGFRANKATRDAVLVLRIICELFGSSEPRIEKLEEAQRRRPRVKTAKSIQLLKRTFGDTQPCIHLADIKRAFPNVDRDSLRLTLKNGFAYRQNPSASWIVCTPEPSA